VARKKRNLLDLTKHNYFRLCLNLTAESDFHCLSSQSDRDGHLSCEKVRS